MAPFFVCERDSAVLIASNPHSKSASCGRAVLANVAAAASWHRAQRTGESCTGRVFEACDYLRIITTIWFGEQVTHNRSLSHRD